MDKTEMLTYVGVALVGILMLACLRFVAWLAIMGIV